MSSSSFLSNPQINLIADASVVINLNATARATDIIKCVRNKFLVTDNACSELDAGGKSGHRDYAKLVELIDAGLVHRAQLGARGVAVYESLVAGSTLETLDDGEAATIAHAHECGGIALIDERKARTLCSASFPGLIVASTIELLMHETVATALGPESQADAVVNALILARMRVPAEYLARVKALIGPERVALCTSLPKATRESAA
jgi:predicted nucleic acid-binding protein